MRTTKMYALSKDVSFILNEGDEEIVLKVGKKEHRLYTSDVLEFCKEFVGVPAVAIPRDHEVVEGPKKAIVHPRRTDAPDLESRTAVSSVPVKSLTREDVMRMEQPPTPIPGVSFGAVDMADMTGAKLSFKK